MKQKRRLLYLLLAVMLSLTAGARTVWTGSQVLDWNNSSYLSINAATMGTVSAGDCVVLTYTASSSAQVQLVGNDGSWNNLETRMVSEGNGTTRFYLTAGYAAKMTKGFHVSGVNATLTQIDIEKGDGSDYSNSVWIGETAIAQDWSNWQTVGKEAFASAKTNYYIRFKFKNLLAGAQFGLQYNNGSQWEAMPGVTNVSISSLYQQYTITSDMLTALQTYGCIVRGGGYTLTGIDIIDPSTLKTLTFGLTATDNSNFVWTGKPSVKLTVKNDNAEEVTANCVLHIYTDKNASYKTVKKSVVVPASTTETVNLSFTAEPGYYRIYATVNDEMVRQAFVVGVQPTLISSAPDKQNDYATFWAAAKKQLDAIGINAKLTEITSKSTAARKVYLVEMQSIPDGTSGNPVTIRGYYCEPTGSGTYPVIMHYLGYDSSYRPSGDSATPYCPSGDANPGYAEFFLSTRGQSINNRPSKDRADGIEQDFTNTYGDWFAYNFGKKDAYYYRGAYMDCVRAIDFMASRSTSDMTQLYAEGQSQGGAFTYAAAALSGRTFKAIAPAIPFMGDFPDYFKVASWPANVALEKKGTMTDDEMYTFLSYFDTKNLAATITCPVITSIGLQDNVCPPHTNIAPYNNLPSTVEKRVVFNPELGHQVNSSWYDTYMSFFTQASEGKFLADNEDYLNTAEITTEAWKQAFVFPTSVVETLAVGDKITYTITETAYDADNNKWPQLHLYTKSDTDSRKDEYNIVKLKDGVLYNNGASINVPTDIEYTINETDLAVIKEYNLLYLSGTAGVKFTKVKLTHYMAPNTDKEDINITTTLYEGNTALNNWSKNYEQPANIINALKAGDKLTVTIGAITPGSTNSQLRIAWKSDNSSYIGETGINNQAMPYTYEHTLTADEVAAIQAAKNLYLNGCNIIVTKWTLTTTKTVYAERGNAAETLWKGSQVIDWSTKPSTFTTIEASAFTNATAGKKLRLNFSNMKQGAQGRIVNGNWNVFDDANTYEKLPTAWGDYYEFALTNDMVTELKANGMHVTGTGYTLTSVQLIDPMREYLVSATFDTNDIKAWEPADGTPNLSVTLTSQEESTITVPVSATLMTDMFADYQTYTQNVTLIPGETKTIDLELSGLTPGFYRMAAKANGNQLCTYYIGYDPTNIVSPNDAQNDFWAFWDGWTAKLDAIDMKVSKTLLEDYSTGSRNVYEVSMQSAPDTDGATPVTIYGYYAEPKAEGSYPCLIRFHGTDGGTSKLSVPGTDTNTDWCEYYFSARGQMLSREKAGNHYKVDNKTDFYAYGLGDNDKHYYRMAYLDTRRAVDFVYSQDKVNKNAVFAAGGSQGGCFTYVCAALNTGRIKAIAPSITGHADFVHTMEIVGWPTNVFNNWINAAVEAGTYSSYEEGKAALLRHQSYFDTKNFASRITCPVITNFSLQDQTDGPHLNISPYNLLTKVNAADKQYSINPFLGHSAKNGWETEFMAFFKKYINKEVFNMSEATYATYYHSTATLLPAGVKAATIDAADNKRQTLTINWRYDGNDDTKNIIPGRTAVMLKSDAGNYKLTLLPSNTDKAPTGNLLHGSDVRTTTTGGNVFYKLAYGPSTDAVLKDKIAWFYGADGGAAFQIDAHKAWLALSTEKAAAARYFTLDDSDQTTGIEDNIHPTASNSHKVYDLQGRRVVKPTKGLYIVNRKKVFIK